MIIWIRNVQLVLFGHFQVFFFISSIIFSLLVYLDQCKSSETGSRRARYSCQGLRTIQNRAMAKRLIFVNHSPATSLGYISFVGPTYSRFQKMTMIGRSCCATGVSIRIVRARENRLLRTSHLLGMDNRISRRRYEMSDVGSQLCIWWQFIISLTNWSNPTARQINLAPFH